jgi:hypothetical protein
MNEGSANGRDLRLHLDKLGHLGRLGMRERLRRKRRQKSRFVLGISNLFMFYLLFLIKRFNLSFQTTLVLEFLLHPSPPHHILVMPPLSPSRHFMAL